MPKLKAFDCVRSVFCCGVLFFHCNVYVNGFQAQPESAEWSAFLRHPLFISSSLFGINAVPIFFTVSSFFLTLQLISELEQGSQKPLAVRLLSRYFRLVTFLVVPILVGLATDASFRTELGGIAWTKVLGYLSMTGNFLPGDFYGTWFLDGTMMPCWSIVTEFQGSAMLLVLIPIIHRSVGLKSWSLISLALASLVVRFAVVIQDPGCNNSLAPLSSFHPAAFFLMGSNTSISMLESTQNLTLKDFPLGTTTCHMTMLENVANFMPRLYTPITTRITPFFVGAIFAVNYSSALLQPSTADASKTASWFWYVLSWVYLSTLLLPVDVDNLPPVEVQVFLEVFNHTLLSIATAFVTFCAIVPPEHPYHAPYLSKFMNAEVWATPAKYSAWVYALHWMIMWQLASFTNPPIAFSTGILFTLIVTLITALFSVFCRSVVELPIQKIRRRMITLNDKKNL